MPQVARVQTVRSHAQALLLLRGVCRASIFPLQRSSRHPPDGFALLAVPGLIDLSASIVLHPQAVCLTVIVSERFRDLAVCVKQAVKERFLPS